MHPVIRSFSVCDRNGYSLHNTRQNPVHRPYDPSRRFPHQSTPMAVRLDASPKKSISNSLAEFAFGVALGSVFAVILAILW